MSAAPVPFSPVDAEVPAAGPLHIGDDELAGEQLLADPDFGGYEGPVGWFTDGRTPQGRLLDVTRLFHVARAEFATTGLWPLLLNGLDGGSLQRPWLDGELEPDDDWRARTAAIDAALALEQRWDGLAEDGGDDDLDVLAPFAAFPGIGSTTGAPVDGLALVPSGGADGLALVPVNRPADVVARIGWLGPLNVGLGGPEMAAILRSWEDRYGIVLIALSFDTLSVAITRPPASIDEALVLAAEFTAFCPDTVFQGVGSLRQLADQLLTTPFWQFWWD